MQTTLAVAIVAGACAPALGVSITPVGPEGRVYHAAKMNERGDILFDIDTVIGLDYQEGDDIPTAELWRADGTINTILDPGSRGGWTWGLGEDGTVLSHSSFSVMSPEGFITSRSAPAVHAPDGSPTTYQGSFPYASFNGFTSDGRLFGSGETRAYLDYIDGYAPSTPMIWDPAAGETLLELPVGHDGGQAMWKNPAGGVVGIASANHGVDASIVWWNNEGAITSTLSFDFFAAASPHGDYNLGGVTNEGNFIAVVGTQIVSISPQGFATPIGAPAPENTYIAIEEVSPEGLIVGTTHAWGEPGAGFVATLWTPDGQTIRLQDLMPPESPWRLTFAHDITDTNAILVEAVHRDFSSRFQSFVITGIPAPATGGLLGVLLVGSARRRRR